jgi:hypothetical protein
MEGLCILSRVCVATIIRRVLDWQLDLLDHTQLHTITVYTLHNSQELSLLSSTEDLGSNTATTAATNSYGVPCHYSLTGAAPLSNTLPLNCWTRNCWLPLALNYIAREQTTKKTPLRFPYCWNDVITGTDPKENAGRFHCCVAWRRLVNKRLTVDCWPTACTSQYLQSSYNMMTSSTEKLQSTRLKKLF